MNFLNVAAVYLGISCCSFIIQFWKLFTLLYKWPNTRTSTQSHIHRGLIRTSICRVVATIVYVAVGIYALRSESAMTIFSLEVFAGIQLIWILNAFADVRLWQFLSRRTESKTSDVIEEEGASHDRTETARRRH